MTPEERSQLQELIEWKRQRSVQQLSYPLDDSSRNTINAPMITSPGDTALTQVYTDSGLDTVTAPKAYARTIIVIANGTQYELPSLV